MGLILERPGQAAGMGQQNLLKFNKGKCKVLHLRWNTCTRRGWGATSWKAALGRMTSGPVFFCASVKIRTFGRSAQSAGKASNPSRLSWPHELRVPSVLALRKVGEHICAMCACSDRFHLSQRWKKGVLSANRSSIFTDLLCFVSVGTCRSSKVPSRVKHILKRTVILKR